MEIFYRDFEPSCADAAQLEEALARIEKLLPSVHHCCLCVEKDVSVGYHGIFRGRSTEGRFGCAISAKTFAELAEALETKVKTQLQEWYRVRFQDPAPGNCFQPFYDTSERREISKKCHKKDCPIYKETGVWVGKDKQSA